MVGRQKKLKRDPVLGPHGFVESLARKEDAKAQGTKLSFSALDGLTDLVFQCKDGQVNAHQIVISSHSKFLKKLLLAQHNYEFGILDWEQGLAQLTGLRGSDQNIVVFLPDFVRDDVMRLLSCFYLGEIVLENEVQSMALKNLWKTLCIDSMKLSDLEFSELDVSPRPQKKVADAATPAPSIPNKKQRQELSSTPSKKSPASPAAAKKLLPLAPKPAQNDYSPQQQKSLLKANVTANATKSSSPLKMLSFTPPNPMKEEHRSYHCRKCSTDVSVHGRALEANMVRFQLHMISHFKNSLFPDVPNLSSYYCPHSGDKCNEQMINKISFLCHLAFVHHEFLPRVKRAIEDCFHQKQGDLVIFKDIVSTVMTNPYLKIDPSNCPSLDQLTDELAIYKAFELHSNQLFGYRCTICGEPFKNADFAILHIFIEHRVTFVHCLPLVKAAHIRLMCECKFSTFSKSEFLAHMGHFHNRFEDISHKISASIDGLGSTIDLFKAAQTKLPLQKKATSTEPLDLFIFTLTFNEVLYECVKCEVACLPYEGLKQHLNRKHKMPVMLRCQDCETSIAVQHLPKEEKMLKHRCNFDSGSSELIIDAPVVQSSSSSFSTAPLETIHAVFLQEGTETEGPSDDAEGPFVNGNDLQEAKQPDEQIAKKRPGSSLLKKTSPEKRPKPNEEPEEIVLE